MILKYVKQYITDIRRIMWIAVNGGNPSIIIFVLVLVVRLGIYFKKGIREKIQNSYTFNIGRKRLSK